MDLKSNAARRQPAATSKNANASQNGKAHHTTAFTPLNVERLLSRVDLAELAQQAGAKLHQSGRELRGACPLHGGKNPNAFSIYKDDDGRERWHCYTDCNTGGDAIDFVRRGGNVDFIEAVKRLAEHVGLGLDELGFSPQDIQAENEQRKRADVRDAAARYFASRLWDEEGQPARAWLINERRFTEKTLRNAGWGFCKTDNGLFQYLQKAGVDLALARQSGLLRADDLDFTANANGKAASPDGYIIYPHTWNGRVVHFSARGLNPVDPDDKSRNLPGERQVYWALVPGDTNLMVVEGQADAESSRQTGRSALGLCGVGNIPPQEIEHIRRFRVVYLALDNDLLQANLVANEQDKIRKRKAKNTARLCESIGPLTMVPEDLPHKDMNAWLQQGLTADLLDKHLASAQPWLDVLIEQARSAPLIELDSHLQVIAVHLGSLPETLQARYCSAIERKFDLSKRDIKRLMKQNEPGADLLYSEIKEGRLHFMGEPLGNFWARISHELIVDDGLNPPTVRYSVEGGLAGSQLLQSVQVDARSFGKLDWIPDNWGMRPIIYLPPGKSYLIARAIQEVSQKNVQRERLYTFTGWTESEGRRGFLSACGWLTPDGLDDQIRVDLGANNLRHYALPQPIANADAARASLDFLTLGPRKVTAPIWAAMYAAPLTSLRPLNAVISVYGTTQSGKSTISHLALTHFGAGFIQGRDYHAPVDWTSTVTAIEAAMFLAKDVPLVIDDFAPQFSSLADAHAMHKKAHYVVRSVGNRSARGRSRADLSQQATRFPRGLVLMTAENPLVGQSIVGRMIYVGVEPGDILPTSGEQADDNRLNALQEKAQQGLLAQAMSLYVQYLAEHWERISETFPSMVDAASQVTRQAGGLQNRLPDAYGVLSAAQEVALRCFQGLGLVSPAEADKLIEENNAALLEIIRSQAEQVAAESPVRKFFTALTALLEQRKVYLAPRTKLVEYESPVYAELVGYYEPGDGKVVYLRTEACLARAKEFWRGLDENLDIMPDALRRQLSQVPGILIRVGERQVEVTKFCAGANQRILEVDTRVVEQLYGVSLVNPEK
ncbi:MAG: CHC2 zinc finger domain-containing protein [Anaerolineales bacterium]